MEVQNWAPFGKGPEVNRISETLPWDELFSAVRLFENILKSYNHSNKKNNLDVSLHCQD